MVLKLYVVAAELGIAYELVPLNLQAKEQKKDEYLALNPFGQVPTLDDDGFILYESRAIGRYLALKASTSTLYPHPGSGASAHAVALFEQAASIENQQFEPDARTIFREKVKPVRGLGETNVAVVGAARASLEVKLDAYEKILAKQKYLAGDSLTLADLWHLPWAQHLVNHGEGELLTIRPNVKRWWDAVGGLEWEGKQRTL